MFLYCHERGTKKIWKKKTTNNYSWKFLRVFGTEHYIFLTMVFQTVRSNLAWNNPKTLSFQHILRMHRGYNNVRENGMAKISAAKSMWIVNHPLPPPTSPSPSPLSPPQPSYATSVTYCSWMYKLDLAEILKTTIYMELYPVKMVHDLVTLTCINWNEQANKSLRRPEIFHPFGWILVTP